MIIFAIFTVFSALLLCGGSQVVDEKFSLYSDIRPVNKSESWHRIRNVPIVNYKITHDGDKTHLGVVGPEAQRWFPESIEVVPTYTFLSKDRSKPPKVVNNFPIVDKNIIFTHGIAALQNLMELFEELQENYRKAAANQSARDSYYSDIEERLQVLLQQEENERASIAVLERELAERQTKLIEVQAEEERKIVELQLKEQQKMLEYEAQLMRERMEYEEKLSRENAANFLEMEKELASKRELLERESAEQTRSQRHEKEKEMAAVEFEHEKAKITAELEARARLGKANQELELNRLKLQAKLDTELYLESIKLIFHQFYKLVQDLVSHPEQLALVAAILASIIAAYYLIKETITFLRHLIQSSIGKPVLVRETSYHWSPFPNIYNKRQTTESSLRDIEKRFDDVILSETDKEKVVNLVLATRNTKKSGAPYRHVLLHGNYLVCKVLMPLLSPFLYRSSRYREDSYCTEIGVML